MRRFDGKSMIVTGAARGIGAATARRAAAEGARVVVADTLGDAAETLAGEIASAGGTAVAFTMNVTEPTLVEAMVDLAVRRYGRLDIAVNNAGIAPARVVGCAELDDAGWRSVMGTNAGGAFLCCRAELRQFLRQGDGGIIVNVASVAGLTALEGCPSYVASKHAVVGLTRSIARDYAGQGIRCNAICPAGTDTAMLAGAEAAIGRILQAAGVAASRGASVAHLLQQKLVTPLGRLATAEEQAGAILWLASADAAYVTGIALPVDGGWTSY